MLLDIIIFFHFIYFWNRYHRLFLVVSQLVTDSSITQKHSEKWVKLEVKRKALFLTPSTDFPKLEIRVLFRVVPEPVTIIHIRMSFLNMFKLIGS